MILKKVWFSEFEILDIYQQVNREEYQPDTTTRTETLNMEKQEIPNRIDIQNNENRNTTYTNSVKQTLTQEDTIKAEL